MLMNESASVMEKYAMKVESVVGKGTKMTIHFLQSNLLIYKNHKVLKKVILFLNF